jgi:hypothetical protein
MKPGTDMATLNKPMRLLFIACAGISTFVVSAQLAGSRNRSDTLAELVVVAAKTSAPPVGARSPAAMGAAAASMPEADSPLSLDNRARSIPKTNGDLFTHLSWLPPPLPPAPAAPPPPPPKPAEPKAPPLPFTFIGMLERGAVKPEAFLTKADTLLVVAAGDLLDNNTYRVDSLNVNEVVMTYLPLNIQQTLRASGAAR